MPQRDPSSLPGVPWRICRCRIRLWSYNEIVDLDREPAQANARRVPDCIRDRAGRARHADLTDALDAEGVDVRIMFLDHQRVQAWYVGIHRDVVFGEVRVDDPAGTVIADGLFVKRERDPQIIPP